MNQEIKDKLEQAAETAWEQDQQTNPTPVNPYAYVYGFKAGAETILENPGEWGLVPKAQHDHYMTKYTSLVEWYDRLMGTPCEQVRHQQEIESLQAQNDRYRKALEDVIIRLGEDKRFNALSIAKEALKQEDATCPKCGYPLFKHLGKTCCHGCDYTKQQ